MSGIGKRIGPNTEPPGFLLLKLYSPQMDFAATNGTTAFGKVRAGTIVGQITASKLVRPCANTLAVDAEAVGAATIECADVTRFRVGDAIAVAGVSTTETIQSIDTALKKITLTGNTTWGIGDEVTAEDGSDTAIGVLEFDIATYEGDRVDENGAVINRNRPCNVIKLGVVESAGCAEAGAVEAQLKADLQGFVLFE